MVVREIPVKRLAVVSPYSLASHAASWCSRSLYCRCGGSCCNGNGIEEDDDDDDEEDAVEETQSMQSEEEEEEEGKVEVEVQSTQPEEEDGAGEEGSVRSKSHSSRNASNDKISGSSTADIGGR